MIYVNLIETIRQIKNHVEVVATVEDESGEQFLGISDFFLLNSEQIPEDEDELCIYLENKELDWEVFIPTWSDNLLSLAA